MARRFPIFRSAHEGYGDSRRSTRRYTYNRCIGSVDPRWPGELRAGYARTTLLDSGGTNPPVYAAEWENASATPLVLYTRDNVTRKVQNGSASADGTLTTTATHGCLHDDGTGIPYYYTCYGGQAGASKVQRRDRAGTLTAFSNLIADKMLSVVGDFYITATPTSGTANCGVGKIAAGTSITLAIAQPALTIVGFAGYGINNLVGLKGAPVALKREGIFTYDAGRDKWVNRAGPSWPIHPDNGKAFWYEDDDLIVALGSGGAVRFDGYTVRPYDLIPLHATPNQDTTSQLIAAGGSLRHWGVAVTKIGAKPQRAGGVSGGTSRIDFGKTTDGGVSYTNYSSAVSDSDPTTVADLSSLDTANNGDWFVIGHPERFAGFYLEIGNANANAAAMEVDLWDGAAWTRIGTISDFTAAGTLTPTLGRSGWVLITQFGTAAWEKTTLTVGTAKNRYWMRVRVDALLDASVSVKSVKLLPARPDIHSDFSKDGTDRSGNWPHLLFSRTDEQGRHLVHDMGTMALEEQGFVLYAPTGGSSRNSERQLMVFGKNDIETWDIPDDDRPHQYLWPVLDQSYALVELPEIALADEVPDISDAGALKALHLDGEDWHATGYAFYRYDDGRPWALAGKFDALPATLPVRGDGYGRSVAVAVGWVLSSTQQTTPRTPRITLIDGEAEAVAKPHRRLPAQSPAIV